jgi:hypothetical protein
MNRYEYQALHPHTRQDSISVSLHSRRPTHLRINIAPAQSDHEMASITSTIFVIGPTHTTESNILFKCERNLPVFSHPIGLSILSLELQGFCLSFCDPVAIPPPHSFGPSCENLFALQCFQNYKKQFGTSDTESNITYQHFPGNGTGLTGDNYEYCHN